METLSFLLGAHVATEVENYLHPSQLQFWKQQYDVSTMDTDVVMMYVRYVSTTKEYSHEVLYRLCRLNAVAEMECLAMDNEQFAKQVFWIIEFCLQRPFAKGVMNWCMIRIRSVPDVMLLPFLYRHVYSPQDANGYLWLEMNGMIDHDSNVIFDAIRYDDVEWVKLLKRDVQDFTYIEYAMSHRSIRTLCYMAQEYSNKTGLFLWWLRFAQTTTEVQMVESVCQPLSSTLVDISDVCPAIIPYLIQRYRTTITVEELILNADANLEYDRALQLMHYCETSVMLHPSCLEILRFEQLQKLFTFTPKLFQGYIKTAHDKQALLFLTQVGCTLKRYLIRTAIYSKASEDCKRELRSKIPCCTSTLKPYDVIVANEEEWQYILAWKPERKWIQIRMMFENKWDVGEVAPDFPLYYFLDIDEDDIFLLSITKLLGLDPTNILERAFLCDASCLRYQWIDTILRVFGDKITFRPAFLDLDRCSVEAQNILYQFPEVRSSLSRFRFLQRLKQ